VTCISIILRAWLALAPWYLDAHESGEQRTELYRPVAAVVCGIGRTPLERAYLARQAYDETRLARAVIEGRCQDMPVGVRCDEGRATGPWQVHAWCRAAWDQESTDVERWAAGASCSLRAFRSGFARCHTVEGGIAANSGLARCKAGWARRRVSMVFRLLEEVRHATR